MDRRAASDHGIPLGKLMVQAGSEVFGEIKELLPRGGRIAFLCGKGNNGGDGLVAARLAVLGGYGCECLVACSEPELMGEPRIQIEAAREANVPILFLTDAAYDATLQRLSGYDLVVDALLGTGANGEIRGAILQAIQAINRSGAPVLAVDVPSGIQCDTGEELGESVWATRTITFGLPKPFLFQGTGLEHSGEWTVAPIGLPEDLLQESTGAELLDIEWVANVIPARLRASHKGDNGHVLIVAGSQSMPGAAVMAARSALRSGAGLVTVAAIPYVCQIVASHVPECVFLPLPEYSGAIDQAAAELILDNEDRYDAALIGPGISQEDSVHIFLRALLTGWTTPSVIDADAINAVANGADLPNIDCVLTPHPGEMGRLLQASVAEVQSDRFATVRQATAQYRQCILLKGPYSIVGEENRPLAVNATGNSGMATGGMGDVLGGVIATLLAQSIPPYHAAAAGMFWHGLAADICAEKIAPIGYSAIDVANALPQARAKIVSSCNYESYFYS